MTENKENGFFTVKHTRLANIADISNIFAWVVFVIYLLLTVARVIEAQTSYSYQGVFSPSQDPNFWRMLGQNPSYAISLFVDMMSTLLKGAVYGLTLKGISLGLNMIVETDLNYKEKFEGDPNE